MTLAPTTDPTEANSGESGRVRIIDEAAALFLERGYAATSLRGIAAAAGMKAGSLYYHFESKEALFQAILRRGLDVMVEAFGEAERRPTSRLPAGGSRPTCGRISPRSSSTAPTPERT